MPTPSLTRSLEFYSFETLSCGRSSSSRRLLVYTSSQSVHASISVLTPGPGRYGQVDNLGRGIMTRRLDVYLTRNMRALGSPWNSRINISKLTFFFRARFRSIPRRNLLYSTVPPNNNFINLSKAHKKILRHLLCSDMNYELETCFVLLYGQHEIYCTLSSYGWNGTDMHWKDTQNAVTINYFCRTLYTSSALQVRENQTLA